MKTALVVTALAGAACATSATSPSFNAAQMFRRATFNDQTPQLVRRQGVITKSSEDCDKAKKVREDAMPPFPPKMLEFSSTYYKTATRTASATSGDCEWVTNMPDSLHTPYMVFQSEVVEWLGQDETVDIFVDVANECLDLEFTPDFKNPAEECESEWDEFLSEVMEENDWTPSILPEINVMVGKDGKVIPLDENGAPNGAGALSVGRSTYAVAALLGTFLVGATLL